MNVTVVGTGPAGVIVGAGPAEMGYRAVVQGLLRVIATGAPAP
jgi:UDP-glucose 6-dehydrogenase